MLYVENNGETCKDQLCQHPECWQNNIRRVREAVRQRNGIRQDQDNVNKQSAERFDDKKRQALKSHSLPTLKLIDMTEDLVTLNSKSGQVEGVGNDSEKKDKYLYDARAHQPMRQTCQSSLRAQAPHTTPISPNLPEKHAKRWKEKLDCFSEGAGNEKMTKINFHEIYDFDEVCQDWQDMFVSTAYLVWCPSKKKKRKKEARASSAVSERRKGFKNPIEEMLPFPNSESATKKPQTSSKVPTGGQPYSPSRSPLSRMYKDYISDGEYIMMLTKEDIPKSLITSKKIIEQKPNLVRRDAQLIELKKSSSTKVLVDIAATLATPGELQSREVKNEEEEETEVNQIPSCERLEKKARFLKQTSEFAPRKMLPLPSVAIPWDLIPESGRRGHCKNSIPHCVDLDVMLEPVWYIARTSSNIKSKACADENRRKEAWDDIPKTSLPQTGQERNHLTSAYRFSPRNVGTPAPTPATPGTRDSRRQRLSLRRTSTKDSLSRTRLTDVSEHEHGVGDGRYPKQIPTVKCSRTHSDRAIVEVADSNRETLERVGNEPSTMSLRQNEAKSSHVNIETQGPDLDKGPGSESAMSDRAVSPSSRTNIPPDIWAELKSGGAFDHRRMTPRSNLDIRYTDRPKSLMRSYHSSIGLSIYSYTGENNYKPHPPRLPKSFTYMGAYKPTILPQMPAALTVVPAPSVTRSSHVSEPYEVKVRLSKVRSIRLPRVPTVSPVPNIDIAVASSTSIVPESCLETFEKTATSGESKHVSRSSNEEKKLRQNDSSDEEVSQEKEYLISREVVQEYGVKLSQDNVNQSAGADDHDSKEALQDLVNSDKHTLEDTMRLMEALAAETDEFMNTLPKVPSTKSELTCSKSEKANTLTESSTISEIRDESIEQKSSKDKMSCVEDEITNSKDEVTRSEEKITCTKDDVTCTVDDTTCTVDENTCPKDKITHEAREENETVPDTIVSIEMDERDANSATELQSEEIRDRITESNSNEVQNEDEKPITSPDRLNPQTSSPTKDAQESYNLLPGENVKSILSEVSCIPKVPSNFELTPFNMESELLLPIKIDSDLLLLNDDSFTDLSLEADKINLSSDSTDAHEDRT